MLRTYPRTKLSEFYVFQNTRMLQNKICLYSTCTLAVMYFVYNEICITVFSKPIWNSIRNNQQMPLYTVNFIPLLSSLYMFRAAHTPIIRSTKFNCIYSHWYNHRLA